MTNRGRSDLTSSEDLDGPTRGTVQLPIHVAWSGLTRFDLDRPKQRMSMYRTVLAEGQADDLVTLLNRDLLVAQWPVLRSLISRTNREVWESAFPELPSFPSGLLREAH
ncbi:transcriptional regulator [Streptomyces sp. NPDC096153]|uniref:transcriptional regulator n=1 Tax=Streptomyces sp. NPDC096153 TaxID=3155548 RepID=UPI003331A836